MSDVPPVSSVPDTTAWAAEHLRGLGWTVVEPVDPAAAIPEPQVGQVWVPEDGALHARRIYRVRPTWLSYALCERCPCCDTLVRTESEADQSDRFEEWRIWVRRTNARPLPTPTDGATP